MEPFHPTSHSNKTLPEKLQLRNLPLVWELESWHSIAFQGIFARGYRVHALLKNNREYGHKKLIK